MSAATASVPVRQTLAPSWTDPQGRRRPPGPPKLPIIGAGFGVSTDFLSAMLRYRERYGDVVYLRMPLNDLYLFNHPDDVQAVLVGEHAHVMKDELTRLLSMIVGQGLLTSEGALWKRQRKIAAPSFQRRHIERFGEAMVERTLRGVERFPTSSRRDVHADMMRITLEIVLDTMFGTDTVRDIDGVSSIVEDLMTGYAREHLGWRRLLPRVLRRRAFAHLDDAVRRLDAILYELIAARRGSEAGDADLLDRLLAAQDDEGQGMSDEQLRDEVATVFLAGHETTALALTYTLHLLAHHPRVARQLVAEVQEVLGDRPPTVDDVPRLRWCDAVLRESMRLYPPAYLIGRELLEDREIGGYSVPKGAQVLTGQWVVHRDPRWFPAPEVFWPERWLDGLASRLHRFAYFPFGGGPRICVGNHFAILEGVLVLATLVQHIEVSPFSGAPPLTLSTAVTLRPTRGVWLEVRRRRASSSTTTG